MTKLTARNINIVSFIISIVFFFLFNIFIINKTEVKIAIEATDNQEVSSVTMIENVEENKQEASAETHLDNLEEVNKQNSNWLIKIPIINLYAEISEGTSSEVMNKYVGHFEETKIEYGNVGLAAHNRGYPVNYFQDLKKLEEGNEIIYQHGDFEMTYVVEKMEIIENTNWEYLENTEDNRITLITCVENEPKYRRCIQGIEKIESEEY